MNIPHTVIRKILLLIKNDPFYENVTLTTAYENEIKPSPVTQPIIAFAMDKHTVGDRQIIVNSDGSQTLSKNRIAESVIKASIFVPYDSGAEAGYLLADYLYSYLLFNTELGIVGCRYYDSNYVRDCGALVLETDFTIRHTESE